MAKVAKDGSITRLRNGRFWVRSPVQPDGTRRGLGTYATREEAEEILTIALARMGTLLKERPMAFAKFAREVLDLREEEGVRGIDKERSRFECHVADSLIGRMGLTEIQPAHVAELMRGLMRKNAQDKRGTRKISRRTAQRCLSIVSVVFREAVQRGLVASNPTTGIEIRRRADEGTKETWTFLTLEEQRALVSCPAIPYEDRLIIRFALATGIRQGELCHNFLRDLHVDGPEPHLYVRHGSNGKAPKSGKARRVPLFGDGLAAAKEWLEVRKTYVRRAGRHEVSQDEGLIFPTRSGCRRQCGKPLGNGARNAAGQWVDRFAKYLALAGIQDRPGLHWHALRHTCATSLLEGWWGSPWALEEVKEMLGHSSVAVTQRYAHHAGTRLRAAAARTASAGYALVTDPPGEDAKYLSHFRDLNSRPTVYERHGQPNASTRLIAKEPPKTGPRHQLSTAATLAETMLKLVRDGSPEAALAVAVSLASGVLATQSAEVQDSPAPVALLGSG